jgi:hypothetical protein
VLFNKNIQDVLIGSLLGDFCISKAGRGPKFIKEMVTSNFSMLFICISFYKLAIVLPSLRILTLLRVAIGIVAIVLLYTAALSSYVVYIQSIGS